jgi:hypothetical protein
MRNKKCVFVKPKNGRAARRELTHNAAEFCLNNARSQTVDPDTVCATLPGEHLQETKCKVAEWARPAQHLAPASHSGHLGQSQQCRFGDRVGPKVAERGIACNAADEKDVPARA